MTSLTPLPTTEDWYGNLLWIDGRKCLLLSHAGTLFTIFEPDVRAAGLRDTGRLSDRADRTGAGAGQPTWPSRSSMPWTWTAGWQAPASPTSASGSGATILNARGYRQPIELARQRAEAAR